MKGYKYLNVSHVEAMLSDGQIKVATPEHYAGIEGVRADPLDSAVRKHVTSLRVDGYPDKAFLDAMNSTGLIAYGPEAKNPSITNCTFERRQAGCLVYCVADSPNLPRDDGTAVIEIADVELFAHRIRAANVFLGRIAVKAVDYDKVDFPDLEIMPAPSVFRKDERFRHEQEVRISWAIEPVRGGPDFLILSGRRAAKLLKRIA